MLQTYQEDPIERIYGQRNSKGYYESIHDRKHLASSSKGFRRLNPTLHCNSILRIDSSMAILHPFYSDLFRLYVDILDGFIFMEEINLIPANDIVVPPSCVSSLVRRTRKRNGDGMKTNKWKTILFNADKAKFEADVFGDSFLPWSWKRIMEEDESNVLLWTIGKHILFIRSPT